MLRRPLKVLFVALVAASASPASGASPASSAFTGTWTMEQIPPGGTPRKQGTIVITQSGNTLAGTIRVDGLDVPLSDVSETRGIISFRVPLPESPGLVLTYSGAIQGNSLGVASQDLGNGSYTMTARRTRAAPRAQVAEAAPAAGPAAPTAAAASSAARTPSAPATAPQPATPAVRAPTAPAAPPAQTAAAARPPAAPAPPTVAPPAATQGDYVARLLGQASPNVGAPASPPPTAQPALSPPVASAPPAQAPPPQSDSQRPTIVASAGPPQPRGQTTIAPETPRAAPTAPAEAPPPPGPSIEGTWSAEQTSPRSVGPAAATLSFTRDGDRVTGLLRSGGQEFALFDVRQSGTAVSFSLVIPGTPYETILYRGKIEGDWLELYGLGESQGIYNLTAMRQGPSAPARASSEPAAATPQVALAPPLAAPPAQSPPPPAPPPAAPAPQVALAPPSPAALPEPTTSLAATPDPSANLQGNWIADIIPSDSRSSIQASLSFDGDKASVRVGSEDLPIFDIAQLGHDVGFTIVVPGTPYVSMRYSGVLADDMMQLMSLDEGRGVFTLQARRVDENAIPAAGPPAAQPVLLASPPPAQVQTPPRAPSPPSALPIAGAQSDAAGPVTKQRLADLRDLASNGLAQAPVMGWSSRQALGSRTDDAAIRQAIEGLVESGLNLIGYTYIEIGDGWQGARDAQGVLHPNERFPDMKALGDLIHSHGLKFGLTASAGPKSCNGAEGSHGHEEQDARTFAEWGVDYVAYEWCGAETLYPSEGEMRAVFQKMGEALRASGRDIVYGISQQGQFNVEQWAPRTGANLWRTGHELDAASAITTGFGQNGKEYAAGPGKWNDPGLLQIGNSGMTPDQSRMQLNLWAVLAAPMMLGNDVRIMTRETVALLNNRELIAVNQDRLGRQGKRVAQSGDTQVWAKTLADGSVAVAFFNTGTRTTSVAVTWAQLGIEGPRTARDLWWHENLGMANNRYVVVLTGGASMLVKLSR